MSFLIKSAFFIGLVLLLLPIDTGQETGEGPGLNPVTAFFAAQSTISDITAFCDRNPQTCETGGQALAEISAKAKVSARMIYEYLEEQDALASAEGTTDADARLVTGATGTLTPADLAPGWSLPTAPAATPPAQGGTVTVADAPTAPALATPVPSTPAQSTQSSSTQDAGAGTGVAVLPRPKPRVSDRAA